MPSLDAAHIGVPVPAAFEQSAPSAPMVNARWPKLFRSAELDRLIGSAVEDNLDLASAVARITEADAQAAAARSALFPTLDGSATAQRSQTPGTLSSDTGPFTTSVSNQFGAGLTASYTIDTWGRYRSLQAAGLATADAARFDRDALAIGIAASTANTYFGMMAAKDRIALQQENISLRAISSRRLKPAFW